MKKWRRFDKTFFFVEFDHSCVDFGNFERGACVFREPNNGCLSERWDRSVLDHFYKVSEFLDRV